MEKVVGFTLALSCAMVTSFKRPRPLTVSPELAEFSPSPSSTVTTCHPADSRGTPHLLFIQRGHIIGPHLGPSGGEAFALATRQRT